MANVLNRAISKKSRKRYEIEYDYKVDAENPGRTGA